MKYECIVSKKHIRIRKKNERDEHVEENYKILKQTLFQSIRRYDIIQSSIKYEGIC